MKNRTIIINMFIALSVICTSIEAKMYYVDTKHPLSNDNNAGNETLPWKTITKANQTLVAGDTVYIKAGTYNTCISPNNTGTSQKPITYMNFGTDSVIISDAVYGINLIGKSYINIKGITMRNLDMFLYLQNKSCNNTIAWCTFDNARLTNGKTRTWPGSVITESSQHNWIHHCCFSNYGYYTNDDISSVIDIGNEENKTDSTRYNLIENSKFFHGGHHVMGVYGKFNVIRNNYFHNEPWSMGTANADRGAVLYGDRNLSFSGYIENSGRNLFEGNRVGYSADPPDNNGSSGISLCTSENIIRFNTCFHNISASISMTVTSSYCQDILRNKIYHNAFYDNGHNPYDPADHSSSGICFGIYSGPLVIKNNVIKNNILYKHRVAFDEYNINTSNRKGIIAEQIITNNWDGDTRGNPEFINVGSTSGDPMDSLLPDLRLKAESPCIDSGTWLTTITSSTGLGTLFQVADAGFFMDGWGIKNVQGDLLQLYKSNQTARITSVNYSTNTIIVDKSISWSQNQGVCLVYQGSAPDIGAFEYTTTQSIQKSYHNLTDKSSYKPLSTMNLNNIPSDWEIFDIHGRTLKSDKSMPVKMYSRNGIFIARLNNGKFVRILMIDK